MNRTMTIAIGSAMGVLLLVIIVAVVVALVIRYKKRRKNSPLNDPENIHLGTTEHLNQKAASKDYKAAMDEGFISINKIPKVQQAVVEPSKNTCAVDNKHENVKQTVEDKDNQFAEETQLITNDSKKVKEKDSEPEQLTIKCGRISIHHEAKSKHEVQTDITIKKDTESSVENNVEAENESKNVSFAFNDTYMGGDSLSDENISKILGHKVNYRCQVPVTGLNKLRRTGFLSTTSLAKYGSSWSLDNNTASESECEETSAVPVEAEDVSQNFEMPVLSPDEEESASGLIIAQLDLEWSKQSNESRKGAILKVIVHEVHCVLSQIAGLQHSEKMKSTVGHFYVKAKIERADGQNSRGFSSLLSLDNLSMLSNSGEKQKNSVSDYTQMKNGNRTLVFRRCVQLAIPDSWINEKTGLPLDLMLKLDVRENISLKTKIKGIVSQKPKHRSIAYSRTLCNEHVWRYLQEKALRSIDQSLNIANVVPSNDMVFLQQLTLTGDEYTFGKIHLGLQYMRESSLLNLQLKLVDYIDVPTETNYVYVRLTLMSNRRVIKSVDTSSAVKISSSSAEFKLGDISSIRIEESYDQVCLLVTVLAKLKAHMPSKLLGRVVLGPPGLAYGSGMRQWQEANEFTPNLVQKVHMMY